MHHALTICIKDLRQRMRDRTAIMVAIIAPLALTAVAGMALGGSRGFRMRLYIADLDHSPLSSRFVAFVERPSLHGMVYVQFADSAQAAESAIKDHRAECAVVLHPGFAQTGRSTEGVDVLAARNEQFAMEMTRALVRDFRNRAALGARAAPEVLPRSAGGELRIIDFYAASMTVLFLNFAVLSGVRALQAEVDSRTIARLLASPAQPFAIVAGKFGALLLLGLIQMGTMIVGTSLLFGTHWGNPLPTAMLAVTSVFMAIGLTALLMSVSDDADQGAALAGIVIALLAIVGGQFLPPQGLPDIFETLTRLTPNGQAFYGFIDLSGAGAAGSLRTIAQPLMVTTMVGVGGITLAALRARGALQKVT
jgi:ABC-2 type transport system permease protein